MVSGEDFPQQTNPLSNKAWRFCFWGIIDDHLRGDRENCSYVGTIDSCFGDHENAAVCWKILRCQ